MDATLSRAAQDVLAERQRQIEQEGWTPEHDDQHSTGSMAHAAACYALAGTTADQWLGHLGAPLTKQLWQWTGWAAQWWKPRDRRRNLVRATALLLAEIERLDRMEKT